MKVCSCVEIVYVSLKLFYTLGGSDFSSWQNENSFNFTSSDRFIFKFFNFRCRSREGWWPGLTKLSFCILGARGDIREHIGNGLDTRSTTGLKNTHNVKTWAPTSSHVKIQHQPTTLKLGRESQLGRHGMGQCSHANWMFKISIVVRRRQVHPESVRLFCLMFYGGTWHDLVWAVTVVCHDKTFYHCLKLLCLNTDQWQN